MMCGFLTWTKYTLSLNQASLSYETIHHILTGLVIRSIFSPPIRHSNMCLMYVCLSVVVKKKPGLTHVTSKYVGEIKKQREDKRNRKAGTQEETQYSNGSPLLISRSQIEELRFYPPTSRFLYQNLSTLTLAGSSSWDRIPKIKIQLTTHSMTIAHGHWLKRKMQSVDRSRF